MLWIWFEKIFKLYWYTCCPRRPALGVSCASHMEEYLFEQEEEIEFTEDEEAIKNYLENDDPLPTELLDKIIAPWWNEEPFK